ncbi:hypothetical protein PoB_000053100 [Plakobranchus ocellatus]|uniref:Uncharacterized protein n=1 Tax=Plakobranchus ocellatus TaxID=259542 RepID=A0AAV3XSU4_9GAST|nr:hypothetical protein PoB_000053100 [Plakobranchus ocellatus]
MKLSVTFTLFLVFNMMVNTMPVLSSGNFLGIYGNKPAGVKAGANSNLHKRAIEVKAGGAIEGKLQAAMSRQILTQSLSRANYTLLLPDWVRLGWSSSTVYRLCGEGDESVLHVLFEYRTNSCSIKTACYDYGSKHVAHLPLTSARPARTFRYE